MTVFCKDCKHSRLPANGDIYGMTCDSPNNSVPYVSDERYLVSGLTQPTMLAKRGSDCAALRAARDLATEKTVCGPDGKWFEAKS
jgi:hypothetical protein